MSNGMTLIRAKARWNRDSARRVVVNREAAAWPLVAGRVGTGSVAGGATADGEEAVVPGRTGVCL
jgi:hypothetical protein